MKINKNLHDLVNFPNVSNNPAVCSIHVLSSSSIFFRLYCGAEVSHKQYIFAPDSSWTLHYLCPSCLTGLSFQMRIDDWHLTLKGLECRKSDEKKSSSFRLQMFDMESKGLITGKCDWCLPKYHVNFLFCLLSCLLLSPPALYDKDLGPGISLCSAGFFIHLQGN